MIVAEEGAAKQACTLRRVDAGSQLEELAVVGLIVFSVLSKRTPLVVVGDEERITLSACAVV